MSPAGAAPSAPPTPLRSRRGLFLLVLLVFLLNLVETAIETAGKPSDRVCSELANQVAYAFTGIERGLSFEFHDRTSWVAVYGYSIAYFFVLPLLGVALFVALACRREIEGLRVYCLAIAADYAISLLFFVFFPVPERWAYPDSGAMLLSDRWSSSLIEWMRPISGLDNCFPSSHVSLTVVIVATGYVARVRLRHTALFIGLIVILSTFVLGIHWIPDIAAGIAAGFLSVGVARYMTPIDERTFGVA